MSKSYLILYNLVSAVGWAFILSQVIQAIVANESGDKLWSRLGLPIKIVQSLAFLEILHSMFRLVRSPLLTTILQVSSRLVLVWGYMVPTNGCNGHWGLLLCIGSWALVEVPRYLFYAVNLNVKGAHQIPAPLFWLRYTLFMILYPTGISGELILMWKSWEILNNPNRNLTNSFAIRMIAFNIAFYVPLGPYMIMNMFGNRKRSYKKRFQLANPRPLKGLVWPVTDVKSQERSTTKTNKEIWAASSLDIDKNISIKCSKERNWRFGYSKHVMKNVELCCKSKETALNIANSGLNKAYELFEFIRNEKVISFKKAMEKGYINDTFDTHIIKGDKNNTTELKIPYGGGKYQGKPYYLGKNDNTVLSGQSLNEQLRKWVEYGTIEPSAAEYIKEVDINRNKYLDLSDKYFVLLGATSAMGPLNFILEHGGNIIAVDLNRDFIWKKLFTRVRNSGGTLIFPVKPGTKVDNLSDDELAKVSGSDLLSQTPEIANWLCQVCKNKKVNIGNYTYLDGALHVQLALACDAIISRLCDENKNTSISFLCTPTDNHLISKDAYNAAKKQDGPPTILSLVNTLFCGKLIGVRNSKAMRIVKPDDGSEELYIVDGIIVPQGPNYALAKRLQHWRAVIQYSKGFVVSSNVAPSTATKSVVHNAQFAAAYGGMHLFKPMEIMYQETSLAVMGTLLINDIFNKESVSNPESKLSKTLKNPFQLFTYGSFHGGVWRCGYKIDGIGVPSALVYYVSQNKLIFLLSSFGFIIGTNWLATGKVIGM